MPVNPADAQAEEFQFSKVVASFRHYASYSLAANNRRRKDLLALPQEDRVLLDKLGYLGKLADVDKAIQANAVFLSEMVENPEIFEHGIEGSGNEVEQPHSHTHDHGHSYSHGIPTIGPERKRTKAGRPSDAEMDKIRSTLKQFVRDWSAEGRDEREACYTPIKEALVQFYGSIPKDERSKLRVLVPGAGLGRLAWDIANLGFSCQGNEFSHYMLLASHLILNKSNEIDMHTIYPYVHSFSNIANSAGLLRPIRIPDVLPSSIPPGVDFSFVAGDFEEIYGAVEGNADGHEVQEGEWDAVGTCFFIDTAMNIISYLRIIHRLLAPGGVWINLGPLLWHWENNNTNDISIELDLEEVKTLAIEVGFEISNERTVDTTYTSNAQGMLGYIYHASFWTATKKP